MLLVGVVAFFIWLAAQAPFKQRLEGIPVPPPVDGAAVAPLERSAGWVQGKLPSQKSLLLTFVIEGGAVNTAFSSANLSMNSCALNEKYLLPSVKTKISRRNSENV